MPPMDNSLRMVFENVGHAGDIFDRFFARQDPTYGPGWYVFGRNPGYGDAYIKRCARPDQPPRYSRNYNGRVYCGWKTKREAEEKAAYLNEFWAAAIAEKVRPND